MALSLSDEESFVILGSSPPPSMQNGTVEGSNYSSLKSDAMGSSGEKSSLLNSSNSASTVADNGNQTQLPVSDLNESATSEKNAMNISNGSNSLTRSTGPSQTPTHKSSSSDNSLAASFILGEIKADVLKSSVYSQFPSLCSMEACAEDVVKLQKMMTEYLELKGALAKVNSTMKQFYEKTQQYKQDLQRMEQQRKQQVEEFQIQIATLRNENIDLKREMNTKIEQMQISDRVRQEEQAELRKDISEKTAQMTNMRLLIENLEEQQLASFEYIPKNDRDTKEKPDYVERLEHERIVKNFERQMSVLLAENLEVKDMQKNYIDELTCLKLNLTAAEELIKQTRSELCELKAQDLDYKQLFAKHDKEQGDLKDELALLRQQVEIYSKDFEMERNARQDLAGEKEQLLLDLRALQRKNLELIEEVQKHWENIGRQASMSSSSGASNVPNAVAKDRSPVTSASPRASPRREEAIHRCPICSKSFKVLSVLQSHVNDCLDKN